MGAGVRNERKTGLIPGYTAYEKSCERGKEESLRSGARKR